MPLVMVYDWYVMGDSDDARLELSLPTICWIQVALEFRSVSKL